MTTRTDVLRIQFEVGGDGRVKASLADAADGFRQVDRAGAGVTSTLRSVAGGFAGVVAALGLQQLTRGLVGTIVEFQNLGARLETLEGSAGKAQAQFAKLQEFAAKTPFQLAEVVDSYAALKARGLDPTIESLTALGNIAGGSGTSIKQVAEATADAITGEFERLKEFGIVASTQGDKVKFTFAGVTTEVGKNAAEIEAFLTNIGNVDFAGGIERQSKTLGGAFSNLQDSLAKLAVAIGDAGLADALTDAIKGITAAVDAFNAGGGAERLADAFDVLLRVLRDVAIFMGVQFVASAVAATTASNVLIASVIGLSNAMAALRVAAAALFGPVGLIALGAVALIELATAETQADKAARLHQESLAEVNRLMSDGTEEAKKLAFAKRDAAAAALELALAEVEQLRAQAQANPEGVLARSGILGSTTGGARIERLRKELADLQEALSAAAAEGTAAFADELDRMGEAAGGSSAEIDKARKEIDKYIATLVQQVAGVGLSREELIRWEASQQAAKAVTQEQRDAIHALSEALIAKTKAAEADTKATRDAEKAQAELLKSAEDFAKLQNEQAVALLGPAEAVRQFYEETLAQLDAFEAQLVALGQLTPQVAQQIADARANAGALSEQDTTAAERDAAEAAQRQVDEFLGVWGAGIDTLGSIMADGIVDGFDDLDDKLLGLFKNILADLAEEALQNQIIIPIKQKLAGALGGGSVPGTGGAGGAGGAPPTPGGAALGNAFQGAAIGGFAGSITGGGSSAASSILGAVGGIVGSYFGPLGTIVGSFIGGVVGGLFGGGKPNIEVRSRTFAGVEGQATSRLGSVFVDTDKTGQAGDAQDLANGLRDLDNAIAGLLTGGEIDKASAALANFGIKIKGKSLDPQEIFEARLQAVIQAVEPDFARFLSGIEDLDERLKAFAGIRALEDALEKTALVIDALDPNPINQLRVQMRNLNEAIDETGKQLAEAIAAQDPAEIVAASAAAQQAVVRRFEAEIAMARQLEATLLNAEQAARAFDLALLQRLTDVGALSGSGFAGALSGNISGSRDRVLGTTDPDRALAFLDEFIGSVDAWLQSARAEVQRLADEQIAAVNAQLSALDAERQALEEQLALAATLKQSIADAQQAAARFGIDIVQRLIEVSAATQSQLTGLLASAVTASRGQVLGAGDAQAALGFLDQFIGTVGDWLQSSRTAVQQALDEQTASAEAALSTLESERNQLLASAAQAISDRQTLERDALTEQLDLARQWLGVLNQSRSALDALRFGAANPLDSGARLALLDTRISSLRDARNASSGADRAAISGELIAALNDRIQLAQQTFDRPSGDFLGVFNATVAELSAIQSEAGGAQSEIDRLQSALGRLQQGTTNAVTNQSALLSALSNAERDRLLSIDAAQSELQQQLLDVQDAAQVQLDAINAEAASYYEWARTTGEELQQRRADELSAQLAAISADPERLDEIAAAQAALQQQLIDIQTAANAQLDAINAEAASYYEWARTTGNDLQQQRLLAINEQLLVLTGGTPVDQFIAARQAEAADLLRSIDSQLRAFLNSISTGAPGTGVAPGPSPGTGVGGGGGGGGSPGFPGPTPVIQMAPGAIAISVSGSQSPQQTAAAVSAQINAQLPQIASRLLREMKVA